MSSSPTPTSTTNDSSKRRKKRKIVVVRRPQNAIDKEENVGMEDSLTRRKNIFVLRRPRTCEGGLFENNHEICQIQTGDRNRGDGFPVGSGTLKWHPDGRILETSILGTAAAFEEVVIIRTVIRLIVRGGIAIWADFRTSRWSVDTNSPQAHRAVLVAKGVCLFNSRRVFVDRRQSLITFLSTQLWNMTRVLSHHL